MTLSSLLTVVMLTRPFFVTNKTLGSQQAIINALDCNSLWIAQTKEPFLPQYIYWLCRNYMKQDHAERKKFQPVKVCYLLHVYIHVIFLVVDQRLSGLPQIYAKCVISFLTTCIIKMNGSSDESHAQLVVTFLLSLKSTFLDLLNRINYNAQRK